MEAPPQAAYLEESNRLAAVADGMLIPPGLDRRDGLDRLFIKAPLARSPLQNLIRRPCEPAVDSAQQPVHPLFGPEVGSRDPERLSGCPVERRILRTRLPTLPADALGALLAAWKGRPWWQGDKAAGGIVFGGPPPNSCPSKEGDEDSRDRAQPYSSSPTGDRIR
jgi:hypothetical protein